MNVDSNSAVIEALEKKIKGQVLSDNVSREKYSCDASIYRVRPTVIVCPRDDGDVITAVKIANEYKIPVTARTAGTNLVGSCLGEGIILDFSRNMNRIIRLEEKEGNFFIEVEPGVVYDRLNVYLKEKGLFLPPEPSSREICMIGGNIAHKASGARSVKYGSMDDYLEAMEFVTADGILVDTSHPVTIPEEIRKKINDLGNRIRKDREIKKIFEVKKGIKTTSGYNLNVFFKYDEFGKIISHLLVGSEGTLGIFTRLKLEVKKIVQGKATSLIYFKELQEAGDAVFYIKEMGASAIELMNVTSLGLVKERYPGLGIPEGEAHMLLVEFEGEERFKKTDELKKMIEKKGYRLCREIRSETEDEERQAQLWEARKSLVPILSTYSKEVKPVAFVEDIGVEASNLSDVISDLEKIFRKYDLVAGIYGHAGDGNLHLRPLINLDDRESKKLLIKLMDEVYETVFKYQGTITAEHGIGRIRNNYLEKEWGKKVFGYMREVKEIFDSRGILNPGVIFGKQRVTDDLKYPLNYVSEYDHFCIDCGYCKEACPVFRIEGGEEGGRSLLQLIRFKHLPDTALEDRKKINELISLCLGCKKCTVRCPSGVDVCLLLEREKARSPGSFSNTRFLIRLMTYNFEKFKRIARIIAKIKPLYDNSFIRSLMGYFPFIYNNSLNWSRWDKNRHLPDLRRDNLVERAEKMIKPVKNPKMKVALFIGCGSMIVDDGVVEATIRVLQKNRFDVFIPEQGCCGLPMSYYGYEKEALYNARRVVDSFQSRKVEAIVSTCGSCTERLKDYARIFEDDDEYREKAAFISGVSYDISEFLMKNSEDIECGSRDKLDLKAAYHDSCHLVAAGVTRQPREILKKIAKEVVEIEEGCCGGAGGYTFLHTEQSKKIFDLKVQSIRDLKPDCIVSICPGCVMQFKEGLDRHKISAESLNLVQLLDRYYEKQGSNLSS